MILVWGPLDDPPVERICSELRRRRAAWAHLDDLEQLEYDLSFAAVPSGWISVDGRRVDVSGIRGIYFRPTDTGAVRAARATMALSALASSTPARVVNRPAAGRSNASKPFQLDLLAKAGFAVPDTLVTTDPPAARAFLARHGRIVYKSVSGIRSIVSVLEARDAGRLDGVRSGPVQLQRWIDGTDVRVHVAGDRWFATAVHSDAIDYRYAARTGKDVEMEPFELPVEIGTRLVELTRATGLLLSGADLRVTAGGEWFALEVNPSPGFTFYEDATGQPVSEAVADLLLGA